MNIKFLRESKNMTQQELGNEVGVSRSTIAMWETNQAFPRAETLIALAKIFNCSLDDLVSERVN